MKYAVSAVVTILTLVFCCCRKPAEISIPFTEPKLVVSCFISPQDSLIQVAVSRSTPMNGNLNQSREFIPELQATVKINNGTNDYILNYNANLKRYILDSSHLKIKQGETYFLNVTTTDNKSVHSHTTIPIRNTTLTYSLKENSAIKDGYLINGKWTDMNPSQTDNYIFQVVYTSFSVLSGHNSSGNFSDTIKMRVASATFVSDNEGNQFDKTIEYTHYDKRDSVYTDLITLSEEYVRYREKASKAMGTLDSPFSEAIQMYSNIEGGLGIFAGFNRFSYRVYP